MKITIAGAGIAGSYLGRMLESQPTLYDNNSKPGCGCAWGTARSHVQRLLIEVGLNLEDYLLCNVEGYIDNNVFIPLRNGITINKPKLVYHLRKGQKIKKEQYCFAGNNENLIVNATGIPFCEAVFKMQTFQERTIIKGAEEKLMYAYVNPRYTGYAWLFPLDEEGQLFHCGAACFSVHPKRLIGEMLIFYGLKKNEVQCSCGNDLYLADPRTIDLVRKNFVAVGGAAGCVDPITGEGILPAMQTAKLLAETLNNNHSLQDYNASVRMMLKKYDMDKKGKQVFKRFRVPQSQQLGHILEVEVEYLGVESHMIKGVKQEFLKFNWKLMGVNEFLIWMHANSGMKKILVKILARYLKTIK